MEYNLSDLEKHFKIKREETALFFIFLSLLPPGTCFKALNGRIEKVTEETFKLCIDTSTYHEIADDFLVEEKDDYSTIFPEIAEERSE